MQVALFSVVWGITVMHRCCGVYDLSSLHVAVAAPNSPPTFVCVSGLMCTGVRDRGERYAWRSPPCAPRCCYCWHPPTLCWVDDIHISLWWSSCIWCAPNTVPSHCVGESLVVASSHDSAYCISFSHSPLWVVIV
ncbi:retrotransposon hot spot (RHS) protein [Trypanosoma cruzi]|nr:retrotransposon hot spot (RHS) protein [Trypanosoma cruzi]